MPFSPNSSPACALHADRSCPKKLSSEYQLYACGNFFGYSSILEKIAILGQPPSATGGRPKHIVAVVRVISQRKQAEEALQENEERLQSITDNTTAVIYLKDRVGKYILINSQYETLFHIRIRS